MVNERRSEDRRQTGEASVSPEERRTLDRRSGMDRRAFRRIDVDLWIEQERGEETVFRLAGNLSAGGVHLEHGFSHPLGARVKLRFTLGGERLEVDADVVAAPEDAPGTTSLAFVALEGEARERILTFLNEQTG